MSQLSFTCAESIGPALLGGLTADTLIIRSFKEVRFRTGQLETSFGSQQPGAEWAPVTKDAGGTITGGVDSQIVLHNVSLDRIRIPAGAKIGMSWNRASPLVLSLLVDAPESSGELVIDRESNLECERCAGAWPVPGVRSSRVRIKAARDQIVEFSSAAVPLGLSIAVPKDRPLLGGEPLPIRDDLRFLASSSNGGERIVSSVIAEGRVLIPDLNRERKVYPGELLAIGDAPGLKLVSLSVNDGIRVSVAGIAGSLKLGEAGAAQDILPSFLEWIHARSSWVIYLQDLVLIGTAVLAILTRLRIVEKGP